MRLEAQEIWIRKIVYLHTTVPNTDNKINKLVTVFANRSRYFIGELALG